MKKRIKFISVVILMIMIFIFINGFVISFNGIPEQDIVSMTITIPEELTETYTSDYIIVSECKKIKENIKALSRVQGYKLRSFIFGQSPTGFITIEYSNGDIYMFRILGRVFSLSKNNMHIGDYFIIKPFSLRKLFDELIS